MFEGQTESFHNIYIMTVAVCIAMTVVLYLKRLLSPGGGRNRLLNLLYVAIMAVMGCDLVWVLTERFGVQTVPVSVLCNAAWFIVFTAACVMCFQLFNKQMRLVRLGGALAWSLFLVPAVVVVLMSLASAATHWIFEISADGRYQRGPYFAVAYATYIFYAFAAALLALVNAFRAEDRTERCYDLTLMIVPVPFITAIVLQVITGVDFSFVGLVFSLAMYDMDGDRRIAEMKSDVRGELNKMAEERNRDRTRLEAETYANVSKDQMLSFITKQLYGFNLTVDIEADSFTLIVGTGMDRAVGKFSKARTYREAYEVVYRAVRPEFRDALRELVSLDYLRNAATKKKKGLLGRCECAVDTSEGDELWCEVNVVAGRYGRGRPVANILVRNITDARKAEEARDREIKAAVSKDQILSGITQAIYSFNLTIDLVNDRFSVIRGTGLERLVRLLESLSGGSYSAAIDKVLALVGEAERPVARSIVGRDYLLAFRERHGLVTSREIPFVGSDGRSGWCEVHVFMGADASGSPVANVLGRDVSLIHERQIQREREMKAVAAKDQILSGITQAIYGYNLTINLQTLKYTLITGTGMEAMCEVFKKTDDYAQAFVAILGFVDSDYTERVANNLAPEYLRRKSKAGRSGSVGAFEYRAAIDGHIQWHETNVFIGSDEQGNPIANVLGRNITEMHEQADTERRLLVAEQSSAAKSSFLFSMSHDIRTPMNAILGYVEMARKHSENSSTRDCLDKINVAGQHLLALINQVLEMSRIESGRVELAERKVNLDELVASTVTIVEANAGQKGVALERRIERLRHPDVFTDPDRVGQILVNILGNAVKYTPKGGRVAFSVAETPADDGKSTYVMTVEDTGIGMSEEFQKHIFETFSRESTTTASGIQGSGLGMAIVKSLVDILDGTIDVSSRRGSGTKVTVSLPMRWSKRSGDGGVCIEPSADATLEGKRILLVEDNEMNREIARWMLTENGASVEEAVNGKEAVDRFKSGSFDYVLMDIQMPVMDGYAATSEIRAFERSRGGRRTPIVALSANAFEEDRRRSLDAGMDAHLAKPIKAKELVTTLGRLA